MDCSNVTEEIAVKPEVMLTNCRISYRPVTCLVGNKLSVTLDVFRLFLEE